MLDACRPGEDAPRFADGAAIAERLTQWLANAVNTQTIQLHHLDQADDDSLDALAQVIRALSDQRDFELHAATKTAALTRLIDTLNTQVNLYQIGTAADAEPTQVQRDIAACATSGAVTETIKQASTAIKQQKATPATMVAMATAVLQKKQPQTTLRLLLAPFNQGLLNAKQRRVLILAAHQVGNPALLQQLLAAVQVDLASQPNDWLQLDRIMLLSKLDPAAHDLALAELLQQQTPAEVDGTANVWMASSHFINGDYRQATECQAKACDRFEQINDMTRWVYTAARLAAGYVILGEYQQAAALYSQVEQHAWAMGLQSMAAESAFQGIRAAALTSDADAVNTLWQRTMARQHAPADHNWVGLARAWTIAQNGDVELACHGIEELAKSNFLQPEQQAELLLAKARWQNDSAAAGELNQLIDTMDMALIPRFRALVAHLDGTQSLPPVQPQKNGTDMNQTTTSELLWPQAPDRGTKGFTKETHRTITPAQTIDKVTPHLKKMGITRIGNVTGLDNIGIPTVVVNRPNSRSLAVSQGKGLTLEAAKASALMESIESWHAENMTQPLLLGTRNSLKEAHELVELDELPQTTVVPPTEDTQFLWSETWDVMNSRKVWMPYELAHIDSTPDGRINAGIFCCTTNGLASGNHLYEALNHAICEVVERDAVTLWGLLPEDERNATGIDIDTIDCPMCLNVMDHFKKAGLAIGVWDVTADNGIPTFTCLIAEQDNSPFRTIHSAAGQGTHPTREIALLRALTEAAQTRLTIISGARDDITRNEYDRHRNPDQLNQERALIDGAVHGKKDFRSVEGFHGETFEDDVAWTLACLKRTGIEQVLCLDLSKPDMDIPVVKVVIPGLEGNHDFPNLKLGNRAKQRIEEYK